MKTVLRNHNLPRRVGGNTNDTDGNLFPTDCFCRGVPQATYPRMGLVGNAQYFPSSYGER